MSTITREAIEDRLCLPLTATVFYDNVSDFLGHDLAELCRLGKAVLELPETEDHGEDGVMKVLYSPRRIFERARVERPTS